MINYQALPNVVDRHAHKLAVGGGVEPHPSALQTDANIRYARVPKMVISTGFEPILPP